ncbi:hypothetical protein BDV93DRAFT_547092 [Ceratobasidium sp. AG-I]|nr:hypothetical protein BDV93DRAFT_547092 [Ceratobasidium sp. AG-I]
MMSNLSPHPNICRVCGQYGEVECARCSFIPPASDDQRIATLPDSLMPDPEPTHSRPLGPVPPTTVAKVIQAILLPVNHMDPYYITVPVLESRDPPGFRQRAPQLESIEETNRFTASDVVFNGAGDSVGIIQLYFEAYPYQMIHSNKIELNKCVYALTGGTNHPWKGNIVALKFDHDVQFGCGYTNAGESDKPMIRSYLLEHH